MSLVGRLSFPPMQDESLQGLVLRVAEDNLCGGRDVAEWLGGTWPELHDLDLDLAAAKLGTEVHVLSTMARPAMPLETPVGGGSGNKATSVGKRMRWCPSCLADGAYHRRMWQCRQIEACPRHRVLLLERCPECVAAGGRGNTLWKSVRVRRCAAGHALDIQETSGSVGKCDGAAAVYRACGVPCPGEELPAPFGELPPGPLVELLLLLGRLRVVVAERNRIGICRIDMARDYRVLEAGARIVLGWPKSFPDLAEDVRAVYSRGARLSEQYGQLHRIVGECGDKPYAYALREAYSGLLRARPDAGRLDWPSFLPQPSPQATGTVSLDETRKLLGLGTASFNRLIGTEMWKDFENSVSFAARPAEFRRADVVLLREKLSWFIAHDRLAATLGLGVCSAWDLCEAGLVPTLGWNRDGRAATARSVDVREIHKLVDRVRTMAVVEPFSVPVTFSAFAKRAAAREVIRPVDFLRSVLDGRPRAFVSDPGSAGFDMFTFAEEDVVRTLDRLAEPDVCGRMSLVEAAGRLGLPPSAAPFLEEIYWRLRPQGKNLDILDTLEVARAANKFVCDRSIPTRHPMSVSEVRDMLAAAGIAPVFELDVLGGEPTSVYRWKEVWMAAAKIPELGGVPGTGTRSRRWDAKPPQNWFCRLRRRLIESGRGPP